MSYIGEAASGTIPFLTTNTTPGFISVGSDGQFLKLAAGTPGWANCKWVMASGAVSKGNLGATASGYISGVITPASINSVLAVCAITEFTKDATSNAARVVTSTVRKGNILAANQMGLQSIITSPSGNSAQFGPSVIAFVDVAGTTSPVVYTLFSSVAAGIVTAQRYSMFIVEL